MLLLSLIAVPATLVGWHFTTAFNRHTEREKARVKLLREQSRGRGFRAESQAKLGLPGLGQQQQQQRALVREAVEEAVGSLRQQMRELRELLLLQQQQQQQQQQQARGGAGK